MNKIIIKSLLVLAVIILGLWIIAKLKSITLCDLVQNVPIIGTILCTVSGQLGYGTSGGTSGTGVCGPGISQFQGSTICTGIGVSVGAG